MIGPPQKLQWFQSKWHKPKYIYIYILFLNVGVLLNDLLGIVPSTLNPLYFVPYHCTGRIK